MNIKKLKNIVIATSALACATCLTLAYRTARPVNAQADATSATAMTKTDGKFYMEGASIRYEKDSNGDGGIRFASLMQKSWLDGLQGSVATGMIVVPEYELDSVDYVGVMSAVTSGKAENVDTSNSYNSVTIGEEDYYQSLVSFYQIPKSEYNTTLVAISYVSLDGAVAYYTAEPLSRSVASVALGLIEEGETTDSQGNDRASELKGYLLKYSISFKNGDDFLAQSYVEYGEATPAYDGETPEKASDGTTHYLFKGWNDVAAKVTGSATYSAQFYSYEDCNGYYFQEGEKFALPDYKDAFTGETLSYSIGDETIDPSEVNLSAGTYTYKVTVGELGTIENQIEVLSKADYKTNYAKANSNQHLDRFAVNSNNTLSYDAKERNYTYKVTTNAQDASGLDLNTKYTKNLHGLNWSFNDYSALSVDFRIDSGDIPTALKSAFEYNAHGNSLLLTAMVLYSAKGTLVDTNALQKDVWYTAYVSFRDSFTELDVNTLHIYFYSAQESGTLSLKNVRFGDHDYGYFDRVYTTTSIGYTTETVGGRTGAIKVSYTNGVWNNRVQFSGYTYRRWNALCDSDKHAYFAMDIYSPEEKTLYTNNLSSPSGYFDADGNSIDKLQANAWTTVVWEITQKAKASGNATVSEKEDGSLSVSYSRTDKMVGDCGLEFGIDTTSITYYIDNAGFFTADNSMLNPFKKIGSCSVSMSGVTLSANENGERSLSFDNAYVHYASSKSAWDARMGLTDAMKTKLSDCFAKSKTEGTNEKYVLSFDFRSSTLTGSAPIWFPILNNSYSQHNTAQLVVQSWATVTVKGETTAVASSDLAADTWYTVTIDLEAVDKAFTSFTDFQVCADSGITVDIANFQITLK